jgi:DNA-binding response OmpR family regulator
MAKILLIDDDDQVVKLFARWLSKAGYEVECACDGEQGRRVLEKERVDLIITDIVMPEKDGLEAIPLIRKMNKTVPIIAMSGGGRDGPDLYLQTALALGADCALQKPFEKEQLLSTVRTCLSKTIPVIDDTAPNLP